jgi:H+/gluconate symporter-like permease
MASYFDFNLKTAIIDLVIGIIGGLIVLGTHRYWSNRSIRSLTRRINENEAYKTQLNNLASSDRALFILAFQLVFAVLAVICAVFAWHDVILYESVDFLAALMRVLIWSLPVLLCVGIMKTLQDVREHPQSLERIEKRITKLKDKLLGHSTNK